MGIVEHRLVAVGREEAERDLVAGASCSPCSSRSCMQLRRRKRIGRVVTQRLLDRGRHQLRSARSRSRSVGVVGDRPQQVADEVARRLVARDEEEHELRAGLDVGEVAAVDLGSASNRVTKSSRGIVAPRRDQRRRRSSRTRGARPAARRRARCGWSRATCPAPPRRTTRPRGGSPRVARRAGARSRCWAPA